jgi:hypothetical protein
MCALDLQPEHGLRTYHKVRVETPQLKWANTLALNKILHRSGPPAARRARAIR